MRELDNIRVGLEFLVDRGLVRDAQYEIDRATINLRGPVVSLSNVAISSVVNAGHSLQITVEQDDWACVAYFAPKSAPTIDLEGDPSVTLQPELSDDLVRAYDRQDIEQVLDACHELEFHGQLSVQNDPVSSGFHWTHDVETLNRNLDGPGWAGAVARLLNNSRTVVVGDLADDAVSLAGLEIRGEHHADAVPRAPTSADRGKWSWPEDRKQLPNPLDLAAISALSTLSDKLKPTLCRFNGIAQVLVWYWLAKRASLDANSCIDLTFTGARTATITSVAPVSIASAAPEISLFIWATEVDDPARVEAIQQAAALALPEDATDLTGFAGPTHRTASTLYSISRQGAIAEALATRRAARETVFSSATDAAKSSRETSAKLLDRTVVQLSAGIGIVIANARLLLDTNLSAVLLLSLAFMGLLSWFSSIRIDIVTAKSALAAVSDDLIEYRESLSDDDISALRNMQTMKQSGTVLKRAERIGTLVSVGSAVVLLCAAAVLYLLARPTGTSVAPGSATPLAPLPTTSLPSIAPSMPPMTAPGSPSTSPKTIP